MIPSRHSLNSPRRGRLRPARLALAAVGLAVLGAASIAAAPHEQPTEQAALQPVGIEVAEQWLAGPLEQSRQVSVPPGFQVNVFASGLGSSRFMAVGPDGALYVTQINEGRVARIADTNDDGVADQVNTFADGLNKPHGLAWRDNWLYVGETHQVIRLLDTNGIGNADTREVVVPDLPTGGGHFTRTVTIGPDGMLYVSIGSSCNNCVEGDERRAAVMQYHPDGSGGRVYARGLRNSVGLAFEPDSGSLWGTDNGRDRLGDDYPPDEINIIRDGAHYGWPHCHANRQPDPEQGRPEFCPSTEPAALELQAHSAALGLTFYTGGQFPAEYEEDAFVAFHGSWNRSVKTGYKVVRVYVSDGAPRGYTDFATGWLDANGEVSARPVDVLVWHDGSLLVSDDRGGTIFRIWYAGG